MVVCRLFYFSKGLIEDFYHLIEAGTLTIEHYSRALNKKTKINIINNC